MHNDATIRDVRIVDFPQTRVAVLQHRGDPGRIGKSIRAFIAFRQRHHLHPSRHATFNLFHDDPFQVAPEHYRMDLCVAVDHAMESEGIVDTWIPGGRCAVLRHVGSDDHLHRSISRLRLEWLPRSGEELRDFPLFVQRLQLHPDVPEHEAMLDIFLPLK